MNHYETLGVPYNADQRTVKRAYAALIKQYRPDSHPVEFARIRAAYEVVLEQSRYRPQEELFDDEPVQSDPVSLLIEQADTEIEREPLINEDNDDSFNHLVVNKPVIELPEPLLESSLENSHDNDSFNRLVDKPVIATSKSADEDLETWLNPPAINVSELLEQLHDYALPDHEQAALMCFQAQLANVQNMNIDQRMDYEEKLYARLIYADRPALLVFAAACDYFAWANDVSWIKAAQSKWTRTRFEALTQLATLYQRVCQRYNPYFQVQHDSKVKPYWLTTHHHQQLAQEQREDWFVACLSANLTDLHGYFSEQTQRQPIYMVDVLLGWVLGYFVAIVSYSALTEQQQSLWFWIMPMLVLLSGGLSALLILGWRRLNLTISAGTKWTVACIAIILSTRLPQNVGVFIIAVLSGGLMVNFLYRWLEKVETFTASLIERIIQLSLARKKTLSPQASHPNSQTLSPITMNKQIYPLLIAQFLSAFADNAILFTVIAIVMQAQTQASWYIPALQSAFFIAYVLLAPWVGGFADYHAKARVLLIANIIKAVGAGLLLLGIEPLLAYGVVGVGAAIYSPAKYGILPELVDHAVLVKANGWIESSTILAILLGMKIGAMVADYSTHWALVMTVVLFIISALATLSLPVNISKTNSEGNAVVEFGKSMALFFTTPRSRFAVLGGSLFWASAASLRVILIVWAPLVLLSKNASEIADLTLYLTVGIIVGSVIVPRLIPLEHLRRVRIPAYIMAVLITGLSLTTNIMSAQAVLLAIGLMGGMFIVPINAVLQEQGKDTIGSGSAVALQNFFQNLAMLLAVGTYTVATAQHVDPVMAMSALGVLLFSATFVLSLRLPNAQTIQKNSK